MNTGLDDTNSRILSFLKRPEVMLPLIYLFVYIVIHIAQIVIIEKRTSEVMTTLASSEFWKVYHPNVLSAFTVGLSSGLLMLSLAVALKHRVSQLAIAAPASLFGLFTIFLIGQTLVLIAGHLAIFSAAELADKTVNDETSSADDEGADLVEWAVVLTPLIAIMTLLAFEAYLGRAYTKIRNIFPESIHEIDNIKVLVVLAGLSFLIPLTLKVASFLLELDRTTISAVVALMEVAIFGFTVKVVTKV